MIAVSIIPWIREYPWIAIFVLGIVGAWIWVGALMFLSWLQVRVSMDGSAPETDVEAEEGSTESASERRATLSGVMSQEERESLLQYLIGIVVTDGSCAFTEEYIRFYRPITQQQTLAFMAWASGQIRVRDGKHFRAIMKKGIEVPFLRLHQVFPGRPVSDGPVIPAEGGPRA